MIHDIDPTNSQPHYAPIENEFFIGGPEPNTIERMAERSENVPYWTAMAEIDPDNAHIYRNSQGRLDRGAGLIAGEIQTERNMVDVRTRCIRYFYGLGAANRVNDVDTQQLLPKIAGRYLEAAVRDKGIVDDSSVPFDQLPMYLIRTMAEPNSRNRAFESMTTDEVVTLATMLREIAHTYDGFEVDDERATIRNRFEVYALRCFDAVLTDNASNQGTPILHDKFLSQAWIGGYDIKFAQLQRHAGAEGYNQAYKGLLHKQTNELKIMLGNLDRPATREVDGQLYEYYLPILVRSAALTSGQDELLTIRKALPREDSAHDGRRSSDEHGKYDSYNFDFLLSYPSYGRQVYLQAKIGRNYTDGYNEGISVFNYHAGITALRPHMLHLTALMGRQLAGKPLHEDEEKILRREYMRVSALLPKLEG